MRTTHTDTGHLEQCYSTDNTDCIDDDPYIYPEAEEICDEIKNFMQQHGGTIHHPVGTCKMGEDTAAVVDSRLRVHGIEGLRVADASIMPTLTTGNTNAPTIMIGEKCAAMMLEDAQ